MGTVTLLTNPAKKRKAASKKRAVAKTIKRAKPKRRITSKAEASKAGRALRRRRRNPIKRGVVDTYLMPSLKGAAGAVAINTIYDMLPIPPSLQVGMVGNGVKMAVAIGLGMAAEKAKITKGTTAKDMVSGALTVQMAGMMTEILGGALTSLPAPEPTGTGYISPAPTRGGSLGVYDRSGVDPSAFSTGMGMYDFAEAGNGGW